MQALPAKTQTIMYLFPIAPLTTVSRTVAGLHGSFQWIRDAGLVMGHLVHRFEQGETRHKDLILAYALHEQRLQVFPHGVGV